MSVKCNLSRQVFVYADEAHTALARHLTLEHDQRVLLHAIVRPTLPRELLHGGAVRKLVGGLSFAVAAHDANAAAVSTPPRVLLRYRLRFRALVGVSVLRVMPSSLRHVAQLGETVHGEFQVCLFASCLCLHHRHLLLSTHTRRTTIRLYMRANTCPRSLSCRADMQCGWPRRAKACR